jgi:hypothetical protein
MKFSLAAVALVLAQQATAHFTLNYPPSIGFDDDEEPTGPCGGFTPDNTTATIVDFHVDGDTIAVSSFHPQADWLFRASLDLTGQNVSNVLPTIEQTGLGNFCEPAVAVPASYAGHQGLISVVMDSDDGILFQCAIVNFVSGAQTSPPAGSGCSNITGLTASFIGSVSNISNLTSPSSSASASASPSTTHNAAVGMVQPYIGFGAIAWTTVVVVASAFFALI